MSTLDATTYDALPASDGAGRRIWAHARTVPFGVWLASLVVLFFVLAAIAPHLIEPENPLKVNLLETFKSPSAAHLFGTDQLGRDMFSRLVGGTRQSLAIGLGATALGGAIALVIGVAAGLGGKRADAVFSRVVDVLFAFPVLFLALMVVTIFGTGVTTEIFAVGVGTAAGYARMLRGQLLAVRNAGYVEAARAVGHSYPRIIRQHILPNAIRPLVALFTLGVGQALIWSSGLAFLGLGVPPPSPEWGALLNAGRDYISTSWWLEVMPGLAIVILALSVTVIGRHLQERMEGKFTVLGASL